MSFDTHTDAALERLLQSLRGPLEAELRSYASQLDRDMRAAVEAARRAAQEQADADIAAAHESAHRERAEMRAAGDAERRAAEERSRETLRSLQLEFEGERRDLQGRLSAAVAESQALRTALERAAAGQDQLVEAFRSIDEAATVGEILDAVVRHAGAATARVAVLIERHGELRDWAVAGFAIDGTRGQRIVLPAGSDGLPGRALRERQPAVGEAAISAAGGPAAQAEADVPTTAVAWPLVVGGRAVAVLYADAPSGAGEEPAWVTLLGLVARHAAAVLELRTLQAGVGVRPAAGAGQASAPLPDSPSPGRGKE